MIDKDKLKKEIESILISSSGKKLGEESKIHISLEENNAKVHYSRDNLVDLDLKKINELILKVLKVNYNEKNIKIMTSLKKEEADSTPEKNPPKQANLSSGHGPSPSSRKSIDGVKKVIAISSCKGGVGKSTVTVNLAFALKELGYSVGVLDADIYGPTIPMMLNVLDKKPLPSNHPQKKISPIESMGLKIMSFGFFIENNEPVIWRGPMLNGVLNQFFFDVDWGDLDYLLIDLPPGTGDVQLSMIQLLNFDGVVAVSTPQKVAISDTIKGINMFKKMNIPILGLIENMSYFKPPKESKKYYIFGENITSEISKDLNLNFLGEIPIDSLLNRGGDFGEPYMHNEALRDSSIWKSYINIANFIDQWENGEGKSIIRKIFSKTKKIIKTP